MSQVFFQFSSLLSVSYNIDKHIMEIFFRDGKIWQYLEVPSTIYFSLKNAYLPDKFFEEKIAPIFKAIKVR